MNDHDLKEILDQASERSPDPQAKQQAIRMAMAEFKATQTEQAKPAEKITQRNPQGFLHWLRLTFSSNKTNRRDDMNNLLHQKWFLGGVATACVALFAVTLTTYSPSFKPEPKYSEPVPLHLPEPQTDGAVILEEKEVTIAGTRTSISNAAELKREYSDTVETISAEDIGTLPDHAAAESLQRQKGVTISPRVVTEYEIAPQAPMRMTAAGKLQKPDAIMQAPGYIEEGRDRFEAFETNPIKRTSEEPVSTFSIDVDTASYSFVRRQLNHGLLPQKNAVRLEEMVNYFDYAYPQPNDRSEPFNRSVLVMDSPWHKQKKLIHIGIKGYELTEQPKSNIVFLLDVSGSMNAPDKLPLVKQSINLLLSKLRPDDTVAIAVYAGAAGTVLEPTKVSEKQKIVTAINNLRPGGSTAGAEGIKLAYQLAETSFRKDAVNRILLATDGDFNVGITNNDELKSFVERKREKGIFLSVLGFGSGNYHDALMQQLAQNGNGIAAYIDTLSEAQKVLVHEATSSLFPIAKDVKIQVEFNPATVSEYRLLGYETRALKREDFNNDAVDAGDIGAGHSVTALYEITPVGSGAELIDESRYAKPTTAESKSNEYAFLKIRYKLPDENTSKLLTTSITTDTPKASSTLQREAHFSAAVAGFAQLLKDSKYTGSWSFDDAIALAQANKGEDEYGYRSELVQLVRKAQVASEM
ncbi:vWA domain-containing protein [Teredinibacter haidensis]|uniref:vWA domain-containing protein n=1 Tax=Teredinibacter haidensis TaxID=2731755 RepID=UPI000948F4FA|nr:VWA domain-containing protein [Teredinibacter haidensis]